MCAIPCVSSPIKFASIAVEFLAGITKNNERKAAREEYTRRGATGAGSTRTLSSKSITLILCMPAIFTARIWRGRNMAPAAD